ncbi:hypothetical protein DVA67_007865 [Solirubrobacter sp. CPCC 204708]|uniref:DUF202 domain-containing protein n=1 Tax=Solirubrobacter deserti TaxID=2282478 RepID=A0ABT4RT60_9ACTN|nr:hypothetical protein [Solirubrobacter deserti]MBE2315887.1 hypothetical protein [Solirubrobacter deserti]MDA0141568.1 hypothetical protein [Solirubrobacter deserti]
MATQYDPQTSLDDIRRMQARTRAEYVRHGFAWRSVLAAAVGLFVVVAARDLPDPWDTIVSLGAAVVLVGMAIVHTRGAAVRRRGSAAELALLCGASVALIAAIAGLPALAEALELPAPNTFAAAAVALLSVGLARLTRSAFASAVRRQDR